MEMKLFKHSVLFIPFIENNTIEQQMFQNAQAEFTYLFLFNNETFSHGWSRKVIQKRHFSRGGKHCDGGLSLMYSYLLPEFKNC